MVGRADRPKAGKQGKGIVPMWASRRRGRGHERILVRVELTESLRAWRRVLPGVDTATAGAALASIRLTSRTCSGKGRYPRLLENLHAKAGPVPEPDACSNASNDTDGRRPAALRAAHLLRLLRPTDYFDYCLLSHGRCAFARILQKLRTNVAAKR